MIEKLSLIFGSKTKAQEILFLLENAKDVVRQGFYDNELPEIEKFCRNNKIHIIKSNFKIVLDDKKDYSNKGVRVPVSDNGMFFVYFSKDEIMANLAAYYEFKNMHKELGLILGYPECCVNFFCRHFSAEKTNLQLKPTNPYTNLRKRDEDAVLLSHFPCSSECRKSIEMAKKYLGIISRHDKKRADEMIRILDKTMEKA
ncbi:DUF483 domain-containing protein [Candidatus Woesearchaeota archaeon]|nr:DUF483 domain-containing protein [Candidatus Woesearchaeota archaeon]